MKKNFPTVSIRYLNRNATVVFALALLLHCLFVSFKVFLFLFYFDLKATRKLM